MESYRKEVECLLRVVKQRFKMVRGGNRIEYKDLETLCAIVKACFILYHLIVRYSEGGSELLWDLAIAGGQVHESPTSSDCIIEMLTTESTKFHEKRW